MDTNEEKYSKQTCILQKFFVPLHSQNTHFKSIMDDLPTDPAMLVSSINVLLRDDEVDTLEQLCYYFNREPEELLQTLRQEGYEYNPTLRQFRAV